MIIVGINAFHGDASACILSDGKIVAAAEEERFRRVKHWAGFPSEAVRYCLSQANVTISDVSHVAVNSDPSANLMRKVRFALRSRPDPQMLFDRMVNQARRQSIERELAKAFPGNRFKGKIDRVEHHLSHLASAYLASPFNDAVVISIDGFGDFSSAAWGIGQSNRIDVLGRVHFPHSLGIFYQALTQFLGFPNYGDEYKVMGLAPYGKPRLLDKMRQIVTLREDGTFALNMSYFRHATEKIAYEWASGSPHVGKLFSTMLENLLGPARKPEHGIEQRHCDIASSVQGMYEEAFFHLINSLHRQYGVDSLALAGGCAMNSVANGKVLRQSPYTRLYVQPAAGDAGGAVGAALSIWNRVSSKSGRAEENNWPVALEGDNVPNRCIMEHAYLGPEASAQEIAELLTSRAAEIDAGGCEVRWLTDEADLCMKAAKAISIGAVVGWFQGRMEWGPRALGNRSKKCVTRRKDIKDILNLKIKRRESFRPFAPSVMKEHVGDWFEEDADVPFMMQVFQIRPEKRPLIPAVTHIDGSGRLQTVYRQTNPRFWLLIRAFYEITGVPMVLNTSFNENEPVVCRPGEALNCFLRTNMDVLVLGDAMITRRR